MTFLHRSRVRLLRHVDKSTALTLRVQKHRNRVFDVLMIFASMMGDEFYIVMLPLLRWVAVPFGVVDVEFAFRITTLLLFGSLLAGVIKDVANSPRPPHDRVWTAKIEIDRGFVSSHSMNAAGIAFFSLASLWSRLDHDDQHVAVAVALAWSLSIAFSRLYNGVHSWPDIVAGYSLGVFLGLSFANPAVADWTVGWPPAVLSAVIAFVHPRPPTVTASRAVALASLLHSLALAHSLQGVALGADSLLARALGAVPFFVVPFTGACSRASPILVRLALGGGVLRLFSVVGRTVAHRLVPLLPFDAFDKLGKPVALPTFAYEKLSVEQRQELKRQIVHTRVKTLLAVPVFALVFWAVPLVFEPLAAAHLAPECRQL